MRSSKQLAGKFLPAVFCMLAMLLAACGGSSGNGFSTGAAKAPANKQIYVGALTGLMDIKTFDPAMPSDVYSTQAIECVFTGLVTLNDKLEVVDQLAASHSISPDGLTYTFKLHPNLKFSDSTPLTSADVVYSIDRALDPTLKSPTSTLYLALIKDAEKRAAGTIKTLIGDSLLTPDPDTVVMKTSQKAAYFLASLTLPNSYAVEKSMIQKYGNNFADHLAEGIGGAGPFKVSKYVHGKDIELVPNPNYYGPKPQLSKFVIAFYQQQDTAYKAYTSNQLDSTIVPPAQLAQAKSLPNGQYHQYPMLSTSYIAMNYLTPPLTNIKIRQAIELAINKDEISHTIWHDVYPPTNHIVPQGMPGYNPHLTGPAGIKGTSGDPTLAKQLFQQGLKEEGWTVQTIPPLTYTTSSMGSPEARNIHAIEQQMWQNVLGLKVTINDIDVNKLLDETTAATNNPQGLQMWGMSWFADYPDPQDWLTLQFDKGSPQNHMNYGQNQSATAAQQQKNQQLMEQADQSFNAAERMQQYQTAEQQAVNDVAWAPFYQLAGTAVRKPCVVGVVNNAQGLIPPDDWGNIYKTTDPTCGNGSQYQ